MCDHSFSRFFFFNDTATTEIYTLSLHDALPISDTQDVARMLRNDFRQRRLLRLDQATLTEVVRSEEHTSELQSRLHLVCRLLLEKKKHKSALRAVSCQLAAKEAPALQTDPIAPH